MCAELRRFHFHHFLRAELSNLFQIDLMAFLLLTDDDLEQIGVDDTRHRKVFTGTIEKLNIMLN